MFTPNINYNLLPESYLFSEVARKIKEFKDLNPKADIIRMDIGDVSLPLPEVVVEAIKEAAAEMGKSETFHGYGPEQGYLFLRELIAENDYNKRGIHSINPDDIFVSDGAKSDLGNLGDLFGHNLKIGIPDPGYPVYVDANVLSGRGGHLLPTGRWSEFTYFESTPENGFIPEVPGHPIDVIYLCYPNNPTGVALSKTQLQKWVEYAKRNSTLIIFDSAYEAYISSPEVPKSIYEIPGAEEVAVEVRSFSKTAGFTGVRCGYTVVPSQLRFPYSDGSIASLNKMWRRRQTTKFNGVGYIIQKAAAALYTPQGRESIRKNVDYYMENARNLRNALDAMGYMAVGGVDSPYIWFRFPSGLNSWELFGKLLSEAQISSTPGSGFGASGEGYLRFTGFNNHDNTLKAIERLNSLDL